jgi:mitochondrial import inner membrane translocase subunit TIM13
MDAAGNKELSSAQKEELMDQVKQQMAIMTAQELLSVSQFLCFQFCDYKVMVFPSIIAEND